ncbi:aspartyl/asparaginyl beta-hydroxylase isoform X26 [Callithrix jacchus]
MAEDKETKHGGHKNGRKGGLSGTSFFTWFMVIALLGVWTSVAVVWFDLVDYEEVLGKLGVYDADGDGDFDVDDAKVLLEGSSGVAKRKTKAKVKELTKEELKKGKEKPESRKESKNEERKKGKKEKEDDGKDKKIADADLSRKESPKGKKDREKDKVDLEKSAKTKENRKKSTNIKEVSSKMASRDRDDRKESRSSTRYAHLTKGNNWKNESSGIIIPEHGHVPDDNLLWKSMENVVLLWSVKVCKLAIECIIGAEQVNYLKFKYTISGF